MRSNLYDELKARRTMHRQDKILSIIQVALIAGGILLIGICIHYHIVPNDIYNG